MPPITAQLMLATSNDDRFPSMAAIDGDAKSYHLTTGMYPQELLFSFGSDATANLTKVNLTCHGVKKIRVERCIEKYATAFEPIVDCELQLPQEGQLQREAYQVNKATVGQGVRFVKLVILEGYEPFSAIFNISFEGDVAGA